MLGSALNSFLDGPHRSYHLAHEGLFGRNTYVGGADKVSHFVTYNLVSKELANGYTELGFSRGTSILMGMGVAATAGLVTEIGDGTTRYGFSYEDLIMDFLGAGSGLPELRERQVGIEIGLNFQQILDDVGVRRTTWWGYALHSVFDNIRMPFTAVGMRYDLNHGEWRGPDNGNRFMSR